MCTFLSLARILLITFSVRYPNAGAFRYLNMRQMFVYMFFIRLFIFHYYSNRTEGGKKRRRRKNKYQADEWFDE